MIYGLSRIRLCSTYGKIRQPFRRTGGAAAPRYHQGDRRPDRSLSQFLGSLGPLHAELKFKLCRRAPVGLRSSEERARRLSYLDR